MTTEMRPPAEDPPVLVRAEAGPPLGIDSNRRRPAGRVGGVFGGRFEEHSARLLRALGPGAVLATADAPLAVDWDACFEVDGGGEREIRDLADWRRVLAAGRLASIRGAFSLVVREPGGAVTLARDGIGERTLFYAPFPPGLVAASTLPAILASGLVDRRLDLASVARYLVYAYVPGEATLAEGVFELLPGEILRWREGELTRSWLWQLPPERPEGEAFDERALTRGLRARLERAVSRRLPLGEAVGATLSGGVDSSLVVALARGFHDRSVFTYSVSFGEGYANELPWSSLVARHCGTRHRIVEISPEAVVRHLDESIALLSEPIGDPLTVPNALLFREASRETGVVLNGEGGDPCFGGPKNLPMLLAELYGGPNEEEAADPLARERSYLRAHQKCYDDLPGMLAEEPFDAIAGDRLLREIAWRFEDPRYHRFVSKLQAMNVIFKGGHHILPKVDAESFPFGVLPRSPLFDRDVVEAAFGIPPQLKLKGSVEKFLLKESIRDLLPREILDRPKSGMLVPVEKWFEGPLLPIARERLLGGLAPMGLIRTDWIERLLAGRLGGARPRRGVKIWLLLTLEAWIRTVFRS